MKEGAIPYTPGEAGSSSLGTLRSLLGPRHGKVLAFASEAASLCEPSHVVCCTGSKGEFEEISQTMIDAGTMIRLDRTIRPNSYLVRTDPRDTGRSEESTFICTDLEADAGPSNNWRAPALMRQELSQLFRGAMVGRTMYVIPFSMGPVGAQNSIVGIELTDSPYVLAVMRQIARIGSAVLDVLGEQDFIRCLHSVGSPITAGIGDASWPCAPEHKRIVHFPQTSEVWSYGSAYGANSLLGKKSVGLRLASELGRRDGWLAEHMLILGVTSPQGQKRYIGAAFPSSAGKTNMAMMVPTIPGWKIETIGDDIAWLRPGQDGRLYASNPEAGFYGRVAGTNDRTNPSAIAMVASDTIFTNCAYSDGEDVWWEGLTEHCPSSVVDWQGRPWTLRSKSPAAHPNAKFTVPVERCPSVSPEWDNPDGVPLSAILLGGRRSDTVPLVTEAYSWAHGVFLGATMSSELSTFAADQVGGLRFDPFGMRPFIGYNIGDYLGHWLSMGTTVDQRELPSLYLVNWFLKDSTGEYVWPGFGDNCRVLSWIMDRLEGDGESIDTAIGRVPTPGSMNLDGLRIEADAISRMLHVDASEWQLEVSRIAEHFAWIGERLPLEMRRELEELAGRLDGNSA